jgi:predicted dehydrogenase
MASIAADSIARSQTGRLAAIGGRSREAAQPIAVRYSDVAAVTWTELMEHRDVDVIHIALANESHARWVLAAADAGKHVLCEKPFALTVAEAHTMLGAVRRARVFFMEGLMYCSHPQSERWIEIVRSGVLGELRVASFELLLNLEKIGIPAPRSPAAGVIRDLGCYTASAAYLVAGHAPTDVYGTVSVTPSGTDHTATAVLRYPTCAVLLSCSHRAELSVGARVIGAEGRLSVPNPWHPVAGENRIVLVNDGHERVETVTSESDGYVCQVEAVAACIVEGASPPVSWETSLETAKVTEGWLNAAGAEAALRSPVQ